MSEKKKKEILKKLAEAVLNADSASAVAAAKAAVALKVDPIEAIEEGLVKGLKEVGDRFGRGEMFLPNLVLGAEAMEAAVKLFEEHIPKGYFETASAGTVVIGTVQGDIHDLGKNIVIALLRANGFKVYDLGYDTPALKFIEKAKEVKADIIAVSSLMTMSMPYVKDVIEVLCNSGIRKEFKVLVGGGPVTNEWAKEIGADAYARDAAEAVKVAKRLAKHVGSK